MKTASSGSSRRFIAAFTCMMALALFAHADQVEMQNGDRYTGKVLTLESNVIVLKSDVLGTLRIRRDRVASVTVGEKVESNTQQPAVPQPPPVPTTTGRSGPDSPIDLNSSLGHQIAAHPELVSEIRNQVLSGAGPKALAKYDSLVGGLASGTLTIADLRKEAAAVAAQLRALRGSEDEDSAAIFDEYLAILDSFLNETEAFGASESGTNAAQRVVPGSPSGEDPAPTASPD